MLLTSGGEQAHLDVTHGYDGPYLGMHVANTMLPNPLTAPIKGAC
jgi:hypothetical protein